MQSDSPVFPCGILKYIIFFLLVLLLLPFIFRQILTIYPWLTSNFLYRSEFACLCLLSAGPNMAPYYFLLNTYNLLKSCFFLKYCYHKHLALFSFIWIFHTYIQCVFTIFRVHYPLIHLPFLIIPSFTFMFFVHFLTTLFLLVIYMQCIYLKIMVAWLFLGEWEIN